MKGSVVATDVRQRMVDSTSVLLAKKGLQGTSFSAILDASGAPRGSLYHHFPGGKDELVLAAVAQTGQRAQALVDATVGLSAVDVAEAFVGLWRALLTRSNFEAGCAVAAVTVAAEDAELLAGAGLAFRDWRTSLEAALVAGDVPSERAPAVAAALIAACEGATIMARAERSLEPFDLVATEQIETVRNLLRTSGR